MTIKRFQPLEGLAKTTRLQLTLRVADASAVEPVARELSASRGGTGIVRFIVPIAGGGEADRLPAATIRSTPNSRRGSSGSPAKAASSSARQEPPKLALVG